MLLKMSDRKPDVPRRTIGSSDLCVRCGKEYIVTGPRQKYCPGCAQHRNPNRKIGGTGICVNCGKEYIITSPAKMLCPDCAPKYKPRLHSVAADASDGSAHRQLGSVSICLQCGKEYVVLSGRQKYCPLCSVTVSRRLGPPRPHPKKQKRPDKKRHTTVSDSLCEPARTLLGLLARYGISQRRFAEYFGIDVTLVNRWCTGARKCPAYVINMAAKILSFSAQELQDVEAEDHD